MKVVVVLITISVNKYYFGILPFLRIFKMKHKSLIWYVLILQIQFPWLRVWYASAILMHLRTNAKEMLFRWRRRLRLLLYFKLVKMNLPVFLYILSLSYGFVQVNYQIVEAKDMSEEDSATKDFKPNQEFWWTYLLYHGRSRLFLIARAIMALPWSIIGSRTKKLEGFWPD